ncbi:MAG: hypothetical protein LBH79_08175 [Nitrososphaerota archaeon]|jgi:t-SNARE complex subunit (syntaxin)|nr:hypothetical protein [Nitrososphaerota archaeon]
MATPQTPRERITKNETNITHIKQTLQTIQTQLNEVQSTHYRVELNSIPNIQTTLQNIENRIQHLETKTSDAKLSGHDKTALYGSLITLIGLVVVEVLRVLL